MRLPFLALTPAAIFLGCCTALHAYGEINYFNAVLVLIGALAAHISVNIFNEYSGFLSGLGAQTIKTPFSGGSGALVENPYAANAVLSAAIVALTAAILIGLYFAHLRGISTGILPLASYFTLIPLMAAAVALIGVRKYAKQPDKLLPFWE